MLRLIGIRKNVDIKIRERLSLTAKRQMNALEELNKIFEEVVIISTCNRTEIYFNGSLDEEEGLKKIFEILDWDYSLLQYTFYSKGEAVAKHLLEVVCGFHSRILGEDQILGQVKEAYELSLDKKTINSKLLRLFEDAISCGKKFRTEGRLYQIPVSSSSIAVNKALELGAKSIMVMGYGTIGSLVVKYALGSHIDKLFIVVRDANKVQDLSDNRVSILDFNEAKQYINNVDAVISCTSAPHLVIRKEDVKEVGNKLILIDLALPRDIDEDVKEFKRIELYDIDLISKLDNENKKLRSDKMNEYKFLVDDYLKEYNAWISIREISNYIKEFKGNGKSVVDSRIKSFTNKCKCDGDIALAETLIKSTSDYYINKAIKVLKEEKLKGREDECLRILNAIFMSH